MKTKQLKSAKWIALLLALATMFALAAPALAAAQEKVYATTPLNLRSGPGTGYPIVGELKKGEVVTRVGTSGNWSIIEMGNKRVYASSAYLRAYSGNGGATSSEKVMYTTARVNVRTGPGTGYKVVTTLNKGDKVSSLGTVGNWTIIKWNDGTAYMFTKYLKAGSGGTGTPAPQPSNGTMVATANVNVRSGPGTGHSKVGWLAKGELIERTGVSGSWTRVNYNGKAAYVHSAYLKAYSGGSQEPNYTPASGMVEATIDVNVRSGPGTNYSVLGELRRGDRVKRTGISGNWTRIEYKGKAAYVFTSYLRVVDSGQTATEKMYAAQDTALYTGPADTYTRLTTIRAGATVIFIERAGNWSLVEYGAYTGYVRSSHLTRNPAINSSGTAYAPQGAIVYQDHSASSGRLGNLRPGEGLAVTGTIGSWLQVRWNSTTVGYMLSGDVVVLKADSQTAFTNAEKAMYSKANNLPVYTIPADGDNTYRYGVMPLDEEVRRLAYNSTWTKIYADGRILYTRTENLKDTIGSGLGPVDGDQLRVINAGGAPMYADAGMTQPYVIRDAGNNNAVLADKIPAGAVVTFRNAVGGAYRVNWNAHGGVTVYIAAADAAPITTP